MTFRIAEELPKAKPFICIAATLSWVLIIIDFYLLNFSDSILKIGIIGKVLVVGFRFYILFPLAVCSLVLIEIDKNDLLKSVSWAGDITY